ncbi:hypothetical protein TSTA_102600 [Talaromyces stipitatus ATCC 10500]|uniref:Uncharacterized protein n=1 Tax=Talaromyces stipitatus (strain ATCC 10500 / CBS 375.48 / QM 6759 / NRRL 1006) TaxID=441959 RepID=B8MNE0_TALSN|nr:uncharacterized protein TSTA_102600 [Talaromyces stipitatus ATCC 10500]EED14029.1 hypothetical protein TSTA_102600 [Talaromyces stipitatus ATCC 10500]
MENAPSDNAEGWFEHVIVLDIAMDIDTSPITRMSLTTTCENGSDPELKCVREFCQAIQ